MERHLYSARKYFTEQSGILLFSLCIASSVLSASVLGATSTQSNTAPNKPSAPTAKASAVAPLPPTTTAAATPPSSTGPLTIQQAIKMADATHPDVQTAKEKLVELEAQTSLAYSSVFPAINGTGSVYEKQAALLSAQPAFNGSTYNEYNFGVQLTQPLYQGGGLSSAISFAKVQKNITELQLDQTVRDLDSQTLTAFYTVLLDQRKYENILRDDKIQREFLATAESRYRIGNEQALTVLQIKTQVALIAPQVVAAQNNLRLDAAKLASLIGTQNRSEVQVVGTLAAPSWPTVASRIQERNRERIELQISALQYQSLEAQSGITLSKHWPQVAAVGSWSRTANKTSDIFDSDSSSWYAGVQLTIPIFSGLSSLYERRAIASEKAQQLISDRGLRDSISLAQIQAQQNVEFSRTQIEASRKALDQAEEARAVATRTYRLGTSTYLQVEAAETSASDAELAFEQAQFDYINNLSAYFVAFGWSMDSLIQILDETSH